MPWAKIDDTFYLHPKITGAGNAAIGAYARALSYCAAHLTGGFVPQNVANIIATPDEQQALAEHLLWHLLAKGEQITITGRVDSGRRKLADVVVTATTDGWMIPDFLHYHPSREEARAVKEKRQRAGEKGGTNPPEQANAQADEKANAQASAVAPAQASDALPARVDPTRPDPSTSASQPSSSEVARARVAQALDDDDLEQAIEETHPTPAQRDRALTAARDEPARLAAALRAALEHGQKLAPYVDRILENGTWPDTSAPPEQRPTLAAGATGTRSVRQDRATDPASVCPDCGERQGHGHLETCPRMPQTAPEREPAVDPEPEPPPPARRRKPSGSRKETRPKEATA